MNVLYARKLLSLLHSKELMCDKFQEQVWMLLDTFPMEKDDIEVLKTQVANEYESRIGSIYDPLATYTASILSAEDLRYLLNFFKSPGGRRVARSTERLEYELLRIMQEIFNEVLDSGLSECLEMLLEPPWKALYLHLAALPKILSVLMMIDDQNTTLNILSYIGKCYATKPENRDKALQELLPPENSDVIKAKPMTVQALFEGLQAAFTQEILITRVNPEVVERLLVGTDEPYEQKLRELVLTLQKAHEDDLEMLINARINNLCNRTYKLTVQALQRSCVLPVNGDSGRGTP